MQVGILGCAHGHVGSYCAQWQQRPELDIQAVAVWDHDTARAEKFAAEREMRVVESAQALVADPTLAAVVIGAETLYHADLVEVAAAAGKAIVLQKPMALTLEQADRMVAAVEKNGVPFTLAWQMRVDPENLRMRALVESGEIGRLISLRRRHCLSTHLWGNFAESWHNSATLNRDIFADDAAHPTDWIYSLFGMPVSVTAELSTMVNPQVPNDLGIAIFKYANGMQAEVSCCFSAVHGENTTEILGEKGVIIQNYGDAPSSGGPRPLGGVSLKWYTTERKEWVIEDSARNQGQRISGLAEPLSAFLHGQRPPIATAREGRDVLRMVLACYASAEQGCRVTL